MQRLADYASQMHGARVPRVERVGDVVLAHLPGAPARDVEELVVPERTNPNGEQIPRLHLSPVLVAARDLHKGGR